MAEVVRSIVVPVLAATVAVLGYANYQLTSYVVDTRPIAGMVAGEGKPQALKDAVAALSPVQRTITDFPETTAHPIFFSGRKAPEKPKAKPVAEARADVQVAPNAPPPEPLRLVGIMGSGPGKRVLVRTTGDPQGIWMAVGDEYRGWMLREISTDNAVVEAQGQRSELRLYTASVGKSVKR